jgi:RecJ-like exonuclease
MNSCPNCGAPINSVRCSYCGTVFGRARDDVSDAAATLLRLKHASLVHSMAVAKMYQDAIAAMRAYSRGND